jgi:hypothetical protein
VPGPRSITSEPSRHVLAIRDERYAELVRQWMRRAKDAAARHVHGVSGHVIDAVQGVSACSGTSCRRSSPRTSSAARSTTLFPTTNRTAHRTPQDDTTQ